MKILVLGASGMAGHVITIYLRENGYTVDTLSYKQAFDSQTMLIDVRSIEKLKNILQNNNYDIIVNCIGLLIKQSEEHKDQAIYLNSYLPHFLEKFYEKTSTRIIHLSTDCVFSGKNAPYKENSAYDGDLFYDRTKAIGEIINNKDLTFRMSIVGPDMQKGGVGLFNWFYAQTGVINGYTKAIWNGITTIQLAKAIKSAIEQNLTGLYHLVPDIYISKYNLLKTFIEVFDRNDIQLYSADTVSVDKTLVNTRTDFNFNIPDYKTMVKEMRDWINQHKDIYPHYDK